MTDDRVLRQRAALESAAGGRTLCDQLLATADAFGDQPAYSDRPDGDSGPWQTITWQQTREQALQLAAGFVALGLEPGDVVALMMPNRTEHVLADLGALHAGGIPTTLYATLAPEQVAYVAGNCAREYAVLDGPDQLDRWRPVLSAAARAARVIVLNRACPDGEPYLSWESFLAPRRRPACEPLARPLAGRHADRALHLRARPARRRASSSRTAWRCTSARRHDTGGCPPGRRRLLPAVRAHRRPGVQHLPADRQRLPHLLLPRPGAGLAAVLGEARPTASSACRASGRR